MKHILNTSECSGDATSPSTRSQSGDGSASDLADVWEGELSHSGMRITFRNLEYLVRNRSNRSEKLPILKGVSGFYLPAEMAAVMGPSGSGRLLGRHIFLRLLLLRLNPAY